jgi:RNA polymerase sigma factor (TIGR02999 family)
MRHVLVDHARLRAAEKRDGGERVPMEDCELASEGGASARPEVLLAVDCALARLGEFDAELAELVELRFYGGASTAEIAAALSLSERTVKRRWQFARAWLSRQVAGPEDPDDPDDPDDLEGNAG